MKLIGLAGKAGSGKSTAAMMIAEHFESFRILAFADPLRAIGRDLFGLTSEYYENRALKEAVLPKWGLSPREILQRLGTEVGRSLHADVWVRYAERALRSCEADVVVLTDVRFPNELDMIRRNGGEVWWIERPGVAAVAAHASENSVGAADCDVVLRNDGPLLQLSRRIWDRLQLTKD